ncbi:hypothetical protein J7I43_12280 [Chitinophaga sp. MAH-28]|uniref:Regulatory LuxR family protein n=2 Tax=Chitinophagaceae TaxID=563835 RepID=A0ABS3YE81_9BACT|nr:hypothetical protein [Chitinophaga chungangae]
MSLSHMSASVKQIYGLSPETITFNDILARIHPDDVSYVAQTEAYILDLIRNQLFTPDNIFSYKSCYCFRMKVADGSYKLFMHQGMQLTLDKHNGIAKALNIHTDISHFTNINNYKLSIIGLHGMPSYTDIDIYQPPRLGNPLYTKRETEILKLIAAGFTNRQIAEKLSIAFDTVKNHRRNILTKAGVTNTGQLIKKCMLQGVI